MPEPRRRIKPGESFNPAIHIDQRQGEIRNPNRAHTFKHGGKKMYHDRVWGNTMPDKRSGQDRRKKP